MKIDQFFETTFIFVRSVNIKYFLNIHTWNYFLEFSLQILELVVKRNVLDNECKVAEKFFIEHSFHSEQMQKNLNS